MKITENFDMGEFECKCGCGMNIICPRLVNRLQVIRDITGVGIIIDSGCRCPPWNLHEGGKEHSYHPRGEAADWHFYAVDPNHASKLLRRVCTQLIPNWSGGFHYYPKRGFCHTDIGPRRRW